MSVFCENCRTLTGYYTKEVKKQKNIKGRTIEFIAEEAFCDVCRTEIFVNEVNDRNLIKLDEAYRISENIITINKLEIFLNKYNIGKRPLSKLLGWGEITLSRYISGDMPSKQYSDILLNLLEDENAMLDTLERNKDNITSAAYENCKGAVEELIRIKQTSILEEKIDIVAKYLILKCIDITPLALQKLLYYSQSFFKLFYERNLFEDDCEAWIHGPVYRKIFDQYKTYRYNPIVENVEEAVSEKLNKTEMELLDSVITNLGCYSGKILEQMTHSERPWRETRIGLDDHVACERVIEKELIEKYFGEIREKYKMINISDIKDYSEELFNKIR
ncbi:type II toxin-antitoxin system antitoxin SocA domain-containing protein [Gottfriedia acidiceleris]|uniref:type II toxin-antitoxin system antitoxin SocA domain-containing protein n=1 Tax=Gottfriedia acidiceleris TaxID=371036 RepID=UPI003D25B7FA